MAKLELNSELINLKYSTDEVKIGTWVNGKPIYRKTFTGTTDANSGTANLLAKNVEALINYGGYIVASSVTSYAVPTIPINASNLDNSSRLIISNDHQIRFDVGNNFLNKEYAIWAEYTKTTD